jgi:hypothetical protein
VCPKYVIRTGNAEQCSLNPCPNVPEIYLYTSMFRGDTAKYIRTLASPT